MRFEKGPMERLQASGDCEADELIPKMGIQPSYPRIPGKSKGQRTLWQRNVGYRAE